ncbi:HD domain-containing phosphohydrolase [Anaerostipes sp.]|uniref:HD domain-containing phosphohydrolase n=1 Tax=Anaerostipes sp. TaxID=1872530 RepID=UPI0025C5F7DB|nr:HD domain-containing phosphohydrolase [Anaerostipes sp.]MBS7009257.1 HD domain-containing protein [Anaerostipes sp.]
MYAIRSKNIWGIIKKTLNRVDPRLIEHGERVAYIALQILEETGREIPEDMTKNLLLTCLIHDIGAYKTEEIDCIVKFESGNVWEHSIYGCLFLKMFAPLDDYVEAVLYHHADYSSLKENGITGDSLFFADIIHLADRADQLWQMKSEIKHDLRQKKGSVFSEEAVELLISADEKKHIRDLLRSEEFLDEIEEYVEKMKFSEQEQRTYLEMLAYSIDFRSEFMVLHTITTVNASMAIADVMNLTDSRKMCLYYGALLHDVGKVSTPVEILEKPGTLTPEEFEIMKQHVVESGKILEEYVHPDIYKIAVRHHEKLDGSGYPLGLSGEELSKEERICAVADIVSALIRKRSYKQVFSKEQTIKILTDMAERNKICPEVTETVVAEYDDLMEYIDKNGEHLMNIYRQMKEEYKEMLVMLKEQGFPKMLS